jgi:hypothetical protein
MRELQQNTQETAKNTTGEDGFDEQTRASGMKSNRTRPDIALNAAMDH